MPLTTAQLQMSDTQFMQRAPRLQQITDQRVDYNCYEGMTVKGKPVQVYQRGNKLVDGDAWLGSNGAGQFIARAPNTPVFVASMAIET